MDAVCKKSVVKEVGGRKVGIIGYVTPDTAYISSPGENVKFLDEIERCSFLAHLKLRVCQKDQQETNDCTEPLAKLTSFGRVE